jgi:hypothetical protein
VASSVLFAVALVVLGLARFFFGLKFRCRPPVEAAYALVSVYLLDHIRHAAPRPNRRGDTDRHSHGARRQPRLVRQSQLTVRVQRGLDRLFDDIHGQSSFNPS